MELSNELVSQLVKATQDTDKKSNESTLYGTVKIVSGATYVQLDGSTVTTPVTTTTDVSDGDRVTVMIKDHSAVITGNISSPSANSSAVKNIDKKVGEFSTVIADKVNTEDLYAERARIDALTATTAKIEGTLEATNIEVETLTAKNVTIEETLEANKARIDALDADTVKTTYLESNFATIKDLEVVDQKVYNLDATHVEFVEATGKNFSAVNADIENLEAENATIKGTLEANEGRFKDLEADNVTIKGTLEAVDADIKSLESENVIVKDTLTAVNADIENLEAENATIKGTLEANEGRIKTLETHSLTADSAVITQLQAEVAEIDTLDANVAKIDQLIFGSASGNTIQTEFSNAVIAQLGNAQIKSAMIDSISASKLDVGGINTNKITVGSENGQLAIYDETILIRDDNDQVRVQIGKDASGDYSITIWDADGKLMFSEGGITDNAIKEAIIRNDMVSENANIHASKLDISSLFTEINGSTETIKSTKIYLDDKNQTLDVAFNTMSSTLDDTNETVKSQGTQLSVVQGQITNKIWEQDITAAIDDIEVGGRNLLLKTNQGITSWRYAISGDGGGSARVEPYTDSDGIACAKLICEMPSTSWCYIQYELGETLKKLLPNTEYILSFDLLTDVAEAISIRIVRGDATGVIANWTPEVPTIADEGWHKYQCSLVTTDFTVDLDTQVLYFIGVNNQGYRIFKNLKLEKGNTATDWTPAPEDTDRSITTLNTKYSTLNQTVDSISTTVTSHTTELTKKADSNEVTKVVDRVTKVETNLDGFKTEVSKTIEDIEIGGRNLLRNSQTLIFSEYYFEAPDMAATHDGEGNVTMISAVVNLTHDGAGNINLGPNVIATDDGYGNVTLNGGV